MYSLYVNECNKTDNYMYFLWKRKEKNKGKTKIKTKQRKKQKNLNDYNSIYWSIIDFVSRKYLNLIKT